MSEKLELTGKIHHVGPLETVGKNNLEKRILVVETNDKYPQQVAFEVLKENAGRINETHVGSNVRVAFNVRGREYQGRWFVNLTAWWISFTGKDESAPEQAGTGGDMPDENMPF